MKSSIDSIIESDLDHIINRELLGNLNYGCSSIGTSIIAARSTDGIEEKKYASIPEPRSEDLSINDYYEILGVARTASADEIKGAYRKIIKKYHPDSTNLPDKSEAEALFRRVQEAYEVLIDHAKRVEYDNYKGYNQIIAK